MAGTSQSETRAQSAASGLKIRVRYGRLAVAVLGLLAVLATLLGLVLAPFTALSFSAVGIFFAIALGSVATLRALAVRDRNRKLLAHLQATREQALQTPAFADEANQVISRKAAEDEVFDARPGSARRAPAITAEELRAEAVRVARGDGGVKQPATWEPTKVPKPTYVEVREATQREIVARVRPEPIPVSEPLRPTKHISLKAAEGAKRLAAEVSAEERASIASVVAKTEAPAPAPVEKPVEAPVPAAKPKLNLDAVMQRRRA
ncbi:hypothetical protein CIK76_01495 [Glutamicibacter sp. BW80]|uniref:hypothetical protein n=1 Tax=unclassified Glutamicibacter TaxID=2627139 RepID=UPI000BB85ACB|nr:hypothetical protein [Glutamicibacter sp. BW80]PCC30402.1 hypothetical protein CIK76_01495 [Glutamicibacter sp. BW80]